MTSIKENPLSIAVIGDLIGSRTSDRHETQRHLMGSMAALPSDERTIENFRATVGDEIQGIFSTIGSAVKATHFLRLSMLAQGSDIRFGIGAGTIMTIDEETGIQDGSAWWNAREALDSIEERSKQPGWTSIRSMIVAGSNSEIHNETNAIAPPLNSTLQLMDAHITGLKAGASATLLGLLRGESNAESAGRQGISPSANSQRIVANNLRPLACAMQAVWEL